MQHVMLEGALMQAATVASCRTCHLKSWSGVDRCSRGVLASSSSKVSDFCTVMVSIIQLARPSTMPVGDDGNVASRYSGIWSKTAPICRL